MKNIYPEYRGFSVEPSLFDLENSPLDITKIVQKAVEYHANAIRFGFIGHTGLAYYPSKIVPPAPGLGKRDLLQEMLGECRKHHITLVVYVNCHFDLESYKKHPEWVARVNDEPLVDKACPYARMCLNSPHLEYTLRAHKEIMERYKPKAIYIDGFKLEHFCNCPYCQKNLAESKGMSLPKKADWSNSDWLTYLQWRDERSLEIARIYVDNIRSVCPDTEVIFNRESFENQITCTPEGNIILAHEIGSGIHAEAAVRTLDEPFSHINKQALYGQAMDTPIWLWVEYISFWPYISCNKSEIELKIMKVVANGARPNLWNIPFAPEGIDNAGPGISEVYGLMEQAPDMFDYTKPVAEVALLSSTLSRQFYVKGCEPFKYPYKVDENTQRLKDELNGMFLLALRTHKLFTFILDKDLEYERLKKYRVVILPNGGSISEKGCAEIAKYVEWGGNLIATYETSLYDEEGRKRKNFGLSKLFGVDYSKELSPIGELDKLFIAPGYLSLAPDREILRNMEALVPVGGRTVEVKPTEGEILGYLRYAGTFFEAPLQDISPYPGLVLNNCGKGKVVYIPFELGVTYSRKQSLELLPFFNGLVSHLLGNKPIISANLPPTADVSLRETAEGNFAVFVVNSPSDRPIARECPEPLHNIKLLLYLPTQKKIQKVERETSQAKGKMKVGCNQDGSVSIYISEIQEYEAIRIKVR